MNHPEKKPHYDSFIVTPVYGAYDKVKQCVEAVKQNTRGNYLHLLLNDNFKEPMPFTPDEHLAMIDVHNDPVGTDHVEQIGKMMDLGLAYGRNFITFKHFFKLESDCIVQPDWDKILIEEAEKLGHYATLEAYSCDVDNDGKWVVPEQKTTVGKDWVEHNCAIFSPEIMHMTWCFSMVPISVDIHLSRHMQTLSGDLYHYVTSKTHIVHYRNSSRIQLQ
jgi:hypothetical protein